MTSPATSGDTSLAEFLDALASDAPAPGGGAGAALALATAAALVAMTARLTAGKRRYRAVDADMRRIIPAADGIRAAAIDLVAADAAAYEAVMLAFALPRADGPAKARRTAELARTAEAASRVPLQVGQLAAQVIDLAAETVGKGNRNVIGDAGAAAALARAAIRIAEMNVTANLGLIRDAGVRAELCETLAQIRRARDRADEPVDRVLAGEEA